MKHAVAAAALCFALGAFVAACRAPAERDEPPAQLDFAGTRSVLDNGLEVVIVPQGTLPVVTALVAVRSGAFVETPAQSGYSHLLEHMMFKGDAELPDPIAFRSRLRELGILANATTGVDRVTYYYVVPSERLDGGLELLSGSLRAPALDPAALADEVEVVLAELDLSESDWDSVREAELRELLFSKYPNRKLPIGRRETIRSVTSDDLRQLHAAYYVPNNALLVLTGDVDQEHGLALARKHFGPWARAVDPFKAHPVPEHPALMRSQARADHAPISDAHLSVAWQGPDPRHDLKATVAADLVSQIAALDDQTFRGVVGSPAVLGAALASSPSAHTSVLEASLILGPGEENVAIERLRAVLAGLSESITATQVGSAKDLIWSRRFATADSATSVAFRLADDWGVGGLDYALGYLHTLYELQRSDVVDLINRYVNGRPRAAVLVTGDESVDLAARASELEQTW